MKQTILTAKNINKSFSIKKATVTEVLRDINLEIYQSEITALIGPSGVGKSTLLYLLGTLDVPSSGEIVFKDNSTEYVYSKLNANELSMLRNKHIGFVFQFHHLLPEFTALENVMIPSLIAGEKKAAVKSRAMELLETVGVAHRAAHKPQELSGGEQQRIAIARALINSPSIVFADEPTGNLDSSNSNSFIELVRQLRDTLGTTFVIATHSQEVANIADRVVKMKNGQIERE